MMEMPLVLDLPRDTSPPEGAASPSSGAAGRTLEIVVAMDDGALGGRVISQLRALGRRVCIVRDARAAIRRLSREDGPSLAILDEEVRGVSGAEIIRRVRDRRRDRYLYTVLLVPEGDRAAVLRGREAGADDCLTKPIQPRELEAYLRASDRILTLERRLAHARDKFRAEAASDALSGLPNRRTILQTLDKELERARREGSPVAVIMLDLDRFKAVNDGYGHLAGDDVIREAGRRMQSALRTYDTVGRYGGEEFMIVLPGAEAETATKVAERLRATIAGGAMMTASGPLPITASLGVATSVDGDEPDRDELVRRADEAMYEAKAGGRNRVVAYRLRRPSPRLVTEPATLIAL